LPPTNRTRLSSKPTPAGQRQRGERAGDDGAQPHRFLVRMAAAVSLASPFRRVLHVPFARRAIPTSYHFFPSGRCHAALSFAAAAAGDSAVKASLDRNAAEELRSILDMAQRASQRRDVFHTNFLTPPIVKECMLAIEKLADIKAVAQGGYPQVNLSNIKGNCFISFHYLICPTLTCSFI
jgi:hypothetical protein